MLPEQKIQTFFVTRQSTGNESDICMVEGFKSIGEVIQKTQSTNLLIIIFIQCNPLKVKVESVSLFGFY